MLTIWRNADNCLPQHVQARNELSTVGQTIHGFV